MAAPPGIASFDSATAMLQALARFLAGRDFPGLGRPPWQAFLASRADRLPRRLREQVFARLAAAEGVSPEGVGKVSAAAIAAWMAGLYPQRPYPAIMLGSSNGALLHVAAALGIPWLPQTFLTLVRRRHDDPDDAQRALARERETAAAFLAANPDSQLHHMHDPGQDRLMLRHVSYFRSKFRRLPPAYRDFIERCLAPGGTLFSIECQRRWPTTRLGERHFFQFGAVGGPGVQEYFRGSARVEGYLERQGSPLRRWQPPPANGESPEAEWGFEPAWLADALDLAQRHGCRLLRLSFPEPETPSPLVADFYRTWLEERGLDGERLAIESFILFEPYWVLRTAAVPYWMVSNMQPSLTGVHRYLDHTRPYEDIFLTLFAHGVDSVGLPPIRAWAELLRDARRQGRFVGFDAESYPAHFAVFGRYSREMRAIGPHLPLPPPLPVERFERFVEAQGARAGLRLEEVH